MRKQIRLTDSQERCSIVKRSDRSQIHFRYGRRWKTWTRAGNISTAASLLLAQPFFLLLWLAMGAYPAWAQTGASLSGVVTDPTGAGLRDVAVTIKSAGKGETRTITTDGEGHYPTSGLPPENFEIRAVKKGFADETRSEISLAAGQEATVDIKMQRSTPDACASGHEFATTHCTLTWHGITLYGAYDVGVGWVSHGLPENGYNYEGASLVNQNGIRVDSWLPPTTCSKPVLARGKEELHAWLVGRVQR